MAIYLLTCRYTPLKQWKQFPVVVHGRLFKSVAQRWTNHDGEDSSEVMSLDGAPEPSHLRLSFHYVHVLLMPLNVEAPTSMMRQRPRGGSFPWSESFVTEFERQRPAAQ